MSAFRSGTTALVRAAAQSASSLPACPDLTDHSPAGTAARVAFLRSIAASEVLGESLHHASPALAARIHALCRAESPTDRDVRRAVLSVVRYLRRAGDRATPFGLFAGTTTATLTGPARAAWGTRHTVLADPSAEWLTAVVKRLENCPDLLLQLPVVVNNTVVTRAGRLVVPYRRGPQGAQAPAVETSLALTGPVSAVLTAARTPTPVRDIVAKVMVGFPAAGSEKAMALIKDLIAHGVLLTGLRAPATEPDALGHLLARLGSANAHDVVPVSALLRDLHEIRSGLAGCASRADRETVTARMRALVPGLRRHPLALDLRLNAAIELPASVAREVEQAALVLARLSPAPYGTEAWKAYHQRFYERYGIGSLVPLRDVVADSGIGYPDGYTGYPEAQRPRLSDRDEALVRLAQKAALEGRDEIVLDEALLKSLERGPVPVRLPSHLEATVRVHAASVGDLDRGAFRIEVVSVSRGAGVTSGRFLNVLDLAGRGALAQELSALPTADSGTRPAQLSFPPLLPDSAHIMRTPQVLPLVISVEEYREPADGVLGVEDLAIGCDGCRMYVAVPQRGHRVEPVGMHALNLHSHTPPLVRLLTEVGRAQCAQVTTFDWGAARTMPFLPRIRYGRAVLSPARWRLEAGELPGRAASWSEWENGFVAWRARRRLPARVALSEGDKRLVLDLDDRDHRVLLREHLGRADVAVLTETASPDRLGWCDGRAHEVVVPLKADHATAWPALPEPTRSRLLQREQIQSPGASTVLLAALYGDLRRQNVLLSEHLPGLIDRLGSPPWWFIRFRDPDPHLRVRIALDRPSQFGSTAATVSAWADGLRHEGLLADLRYPTSFREMGRWGSGGAWESAEDVFRVDSLAVLAQLSQLQRPRPRTLVAAHTVAIATAFLGSTEAGMRWLTDRIPPTAPAPVPRPQFVEAVRLADPSDDWAALRAVPGGQAIVTAWAARRTALTAYRNHLPGPHTQGVAVDDVLTSLLHTHFVRAVAVDFPEEAICLHLARAAAQAWTAKGRRTA